MIRKRRKMERTKQTGQKRLERKNCFWEEEDKTVVPGTTVRFILRIARVYSKAPGKRGDQAAWKGSKTVEHQDSLIKVFSQT